MENNFENEISKFIQKIKHYLIVNFGKVESISSNEEFYLAFSYALREKIIVNWTATKYSIDESSAKKVYFLLLNCMQIIIYFCFLYVSKAHTEHIK